MLRIWWAEAEMGLFKWGKQENKLHQWLSIPLNSFAMDKLSSHKSRKMVDWTWEITCRWCICKGVHMSKRRSTNSTQVPRKNTPPLSRPPNQLQPKPFSLSNLYLKPNPKLKIYMSLQSHPSVHRGDREKEKQEDIDWIHKGKERDTSGERHWTKERKWVDCTDFS